MEYTHINGYEYSTVNEYKYNFLIFVALINKGVSEVHIIAEKVELQSEARETMSRVADYWLLEWLINTQPLTVTVFFSKQHCQEK